MSNKKVAIPISEAKKRFKAVVLGPILEKGWKEHHPDCGVDPEDVAFGHPQFGCVEEIVICEADDQGNPIEPGWVQMRFHEGSVGRKSPGTIIVPWFFDDRGIHVLQMWVTRRVVRNVPSCEFPMGYVNPDESFNDGARRELKEETGLEGFASADLGPICPEPDWFPSETQVIAIHVGAEAAKDVFRLHPSQFRLLSLSDLGAVAQMDSSPCIAALMRFIAWLTTSGKAKITMAKP